MMKWLQRHFLIIMISFVICFATSIIGMCVIWGVFSSASTVSLTGRFKNIESPLTGFNSYAADSNGNIYMHTSNPSYDLVHKYDSTGEFAGSLDLRDKSLKLSGSARVAVGEDDHLFIAAARSDNAVELDAEGNVLEYYDEEYFYDRFKHTQSDRITQNGVIYERRGSFDEIYKLQDGTETLVFSKKPWQICFEVFENIAIGMFVSFLVLPWVWQYEEVRDTIKAKYGKKK